jgi:hypothetical protein
MTSQPFRKPLVPEDRRAINAAARALVTDNLVKTAMAVLFSGIERRPLYEITERYFGTDRTFQLVERATSTVATTTGAAWAAPLTQTVNANLSLLSPRAAFLKVAARSSLNFTFDRNRKIAVPSLAAAATDVNFTLEAVPLPVISASLSAAILEPKSFGCLAVFSRQLFEYSLPNAEVAVRAKVAQAIALGGDTKMFDATAADATRPGGLLVGNTPLVASSVTPPRESLRADISALVAAVSTVAGNEAIVLVAHPKQAAAYALEFSNAPFEMFASSALAAGTVIAIATNSVAFAVDPTPRFEFSDQGMVHLDTVPTVPFGAGTTQSMWQADMVALKIVQVADWALITSGGIASVNSVTW